MREQLKKWYLEYVNDFLTIERFAEYHDVTPGIALKMIDMGKWYHERDVKRK